MTQAVSLAQQASTGVSQGFKNRIINGAMVIDQRNAGASVTPSNSFTLDRWCGIVTQASKFTVQQNAGSVTPPVGFTNYLGVTSSSAYSVGSGDTFFIYQAIEGYNMADFNWGSANAKTITFSFWVRSSLTGTFGGALLNEANNRSYPFNYTISAANTWEFKSVTIAGDTTGTWVTTNGVGINVRFGLGSGSTFSATAGVWGTGNVVQSTGSVSVVGTNGATWYVTGVQLEVGSTASSFEYRPYTTELQLCQRYYIGLQTASSPNVELVIAGAMTGSTNWTQFMPYPMRTAPTVNLPTSSVIRQGGGTYNVSSWTSSVFGTNPQGFYLAATVATSLTANSAAHFYSFQQTANFSAEL